MGKQFTRYKDRDGNRIAIGDVVHVEEYPDKYVGGSYDFEGFITTNEDGRVIVVYSDIGEEEAFSLSMFPVKGRRIFSEKERYEYWKTTFLGGEPPEHLWKTDVLWSNKEESKGE